MINSIKKYILKLVLNDDETIITTKKLKELEEIECNYIKQGELRLEDKTKGIQTTPQFHNKTKNNTKMGGKKQSFKVIKLINGKTRDTTGLVRKTNQGYDYYYYNKKTAKRPFVAKRKQVETLLQIQKEWNECGHKPSQWETILSRNIDDRNIDDSNIDYVTKNGHWFRITFNHLHYGTVTTLEKGRELVSYLKYKNWDERYAVKNLSPNKRMRGDDYYNVMKHFIENDKEYNQMSV